MYLYFLSQSVYLFEYIFIDPRSPPCKPFPEQYCLFTRMKIDNIIKIIYGKKKNYNVTFIF